MRAFTTLNTSDDPRTVLQFNMGTNHRGLLLGIQVSPEGSTATSAPIRFSFGTQSGAGTSVDATSAAVKDEPAWTGTTTSYLTILDTFSSTEPTHTEQGYRFSLHQQSSLYWTPPGKGYVIMDPSERWGLQIQSTSGVEIAYSFDFEL
jgi:hypothetical protein